MCQIFRATELRPWHIYVYSAIEVNSRILSQPREFVFKRFCAISQSVSFSAPFRYNRNVLPESYISAIRCARSAAPSTWDPHGKMQLQYFKGLSAIRNALYHALGSCALVPGRRNLERHMRGTHKTLSRSLRIRTAPRWRLLRRGATGAVWLTNERNKLRQ